MTDTNITLTPSGGSGPVTVTASAALFDNTMIGRMIAIRDEAPRRVGGGTYGGNDVIHTWDGRADATRRLYRVITPGTAAAANMSGTTPNYDMDTPVSEAPGVRDGTVVLRYIGKGRAAWSWGIISAFTSTTAVTMQVSTEQNMVTTSASKNWRLGAWGGSLGWPRCMVIFQQRTVWCGNFAQPSTVWTSQTGDFYRMAPTEVDGTVTDDMGITATLDASEVATILWAQQTTRGVILGTGSGIFLFGAASGTDRALSPRNIEARRQGRIGSDDGIEGRAIENAVLYVQRGRKRVREFVFDFGQDSYQANDLSVLSEHLLAPGVSAWAYQENPDGVLWLVRTDGKLLSLTYDREQQMRAWCLHDLGGVVEAIDVVPDPTAFADDVYVVVRRVIGGATKRYVEVIRAPVREDVNGAAAYFHMDSGLTYSGTPITRVTGLGHLEGREVTIWADGAQRTNRVVVSGQIDIGTPAASVVHVGLSFSSRIVTLPIDANASGGPGQGRPKRISEAVIRLQSTGAFKMMGAIEEPIGFRTPGMLMDTAPPLFTGVRKVIPSTGWDEEGQIALESVGAAPLTVLAIAQEVTVSG